MKQSDLQFSDPRIEKIDFRICQEEIISDNLPISIEVETESNPYCKEAIVTLNLLVGKVDKDNKVTTPFYFNGVIVAWIVFIIIIFIPVAVCQTSFAHYIAIACTELLDIRTFTAARFIHANYELYFFSYFCILKKCFSCSATTKNSITLWNYSSAYCVGTNDFCK